MKLGAAVPGTIGLLAFSSVALAQTPPPRTGFQMDIRTGYSVPLGKVQKDLKMSDVFSGQVPIMVDIGGKPIPELFIGGYLGLGFGSTGGKEDNCPSCAAVGLHLGVQAQYHILPAGQVNPWIGYGLGFESAALANDNASIGWGGFQFARFMGGADFRIDRVFGVGPFVDLSMGTYTKMSIESGNLTSKEDVTDTAMHQWLTFGVRFVFFP